MLHGGMIQGDGANFPLETLRDQEVRLIRRALEYTGWNKRQTARILGINRSTLYSKLDRYGIRRIHDRVDSAPPPFSPA